MEEKKLKELLNQLKEYDIKKNNEKYTSVIKEIIEQIKNSEDNEKINIISKVYSDEEQSNYIKMYFFNELLKSHIFNNKETKKKCYKLLIDSFNNNTAKDHIEQISKIKELFGKKDDLADFEDIDMYIELFIAENENKHDLVNFNEDNTDRDLFDKIDNKKINLDIKIPDNKDIIDNMDGKDLYLKTNSPSIGLTKNNYFDFNNNILEEINNNNMSDSNMGGNEKKVIKKYKPNSTLPMIIISVSVNLNAYQFLILINQTFKKFNYNNISTIRENEYENLSIYQYVPKNCFDYISEFINNKGKCIRNQFHVHASLKRDENNFNSGINSVLKDIYERKIAIRSVKGIESNIIKFMIQFLKTFCQSVDRIKIIKQSNCFLKYNLEKELNDIIEKETNIKMKSKLFNFRNKKFKYKKLKSEDDSMIGLNTSNKSLNTHINETDSFKYLEIIQILSKSEYGLGEKISSFIEEFKKKYNPPVKNVENINTREIMTDIIKLFDFCITNLNTSFNNKNNKYETNYISLASEQYIFNKIYFILFGIYCEKYKEENKKFLLIQKEINENLTNIDICNKL
jgi:hypothetical protein